MELHQVGEKNFMRTYQLMPGITASNEFSIGLYVVGATPYQDLILYDGFAVYHVDPLFRFSAFNPYAIKDIKRCKGGFEPKFCGRLSSVFSIIGKDKIKKKISACGEISLCK